MKLINEKFPPIFTSNPSNVAMWEIETALFETWPS